MKLKNILKSINNLEDNLIIYIEKIDDIDSDIMISDSKDMVLLVKRIDGTEYSYLIDVFIAKEFMAAIIERDGEFFDEEKTANILYNYALNDA